jgi:serine protease Do
VLRNGKSLTLPVTLENMNKSNETASNSSEPGGKLRWGIGLGDLTPATRQQLQTPDGMQGAVIENVQPGSAADNAGLQRGDVILEVNRHKVDSAAAVKQQLDSIPKGQDALLLVWSNGGNTFLVMHSPAAAS